VEQGGHIIGIRDGIFSVMLILLLLIGLTLSIMIGYITKILFLSLPALEENGGLV
jgi:hypothetical protein